MSTIIKRFLSPFLLPLTSTTLGIYLEYCFQIPFLFLIITCIGASIATLFFVIRSFNTGMRISLCVVFFCAGGLALKLQQLEFNHIRTQLLGKNLTLHGTISNRETLPDRKQVITIDVTQVDNISTGQITQLNCSMQCYTRFPTSFLVGDTIEICNIAIPKKPAEFRFPCFNDYLAKEHIHASLFLNSNKQIALIDRPKKSFDRWLWSLREQLYKNITQKLSSRSTTFLGLIFFGKKKYKEIDSLRVLFNQWGLAHYLARSGLHIILLIGIWSFLFSFLPINLWIKWLLLLMIACTYGILSWASVPFIRAMLVFGLSSIGRLSWHHINVLHLLSLVCLSMLLLNPLHLFFLDFQLTFGLTFALILSSR